MNRMSMPDGLLNEAISKGSSAKAEREGMKSSKSAKLFKESSAKTGKEKALSMHHKKAVSFSVGSLSLAPYFHIGMS